MHELLRRDGHEVEITSLPKDGVEFCKTRHFDLVFLDYHLPETTGDQVVSSPPLQKVGVEFYKPRHFDLVFLDYHLPETTGDQVVSLLRQINPKQSIVLMSGHRPYPPLGEANFFIRKPFEADILRDAV